MWVLSSYLYKYQAKVASFSHKRILSMTFHVILVLYNKCLLRGNFSPTSSLVAGISLESFSGSAKWTKPLVMASHLCRHWTMTIYHCHCPGSGVESQIMPRSLLFLKMKREIYCRILWPSWFSGDRLMSPRVTVAACRLAVMKLTSIICNKNRNPNKKLNKRGAQ